MGWFSAVMSSNISSVSFFPSFLSGTLITCVCKCLTLPHRSLRLYLLFLTSFFFFFLTLFWTEYFLLIFTFSQLPPICCWASPVNFSFQLLYFSNLKFLHGSSFLICFSSAILYLLCVVSLLSFNYLNKHIWNSQFEVFVKSNVEPTWSQFPLTVFSWLWVTLSQFCFSFFFVFIFGSFWLKTEPLICYSNCRFILFFGVVESFLVIHLNLKCRSCFPPWQAGGTSLFSFLFFLCFAWLSRGCTYVCSA